MRAVAMLVGIALGLTAAGRAEAFPFVLERPPADPFTAGTFFSDQDHPREAATPFSLGSPVSISSLVWWGGYFGLGTPPGAGTSDFVIRLYGGGPFGEPEALALHEVAVVASVTELGGVVTSFRFEAALPTALALPAGVPLWLAIVDVDPARPTFAWRKSTEGEASYSRSGPGFAWNETPGLASFRLVGTIVPEPGTAMLAALGLSVLGAGARRPGRALPRHGPRIET